MPTAVVRIGSWSVFTVMGLIGLFAAVALNINLGIVSGLSILMLTGVITADLLTFLTYAMVVKIVAGEERLALYHHKIVVVLVTVAILKFAGQQVLPYLDLILLGVGVFAVPGRFGCLMVACCHGRPHPWGVRYGSEHAELGLDPIYVGMRVIPIQAIEALWMFVVVLVGTALILRHALPGEALSWYFITYGFGRFWFEFLRADDGRGYFWGFSEAQWTSLLLMSIVAVAETCGKLPLHSWHIVAAACLAVIMIVISLRARYRGASQRLSYQPGHIGEIAEAIKLATCLAVDRCDVCKQNVEPPFIHLGRTSLGFQVSASRIKRTGDSIYHYAFSCQNGSLTARTLNLATEIVLQMRKSSDLIELKKGQLGVFHLLVQSRS
jgi:Prolipoprotein diacylglyceryl transferase